MEEPAQGWRAMENRLFFSILAMYTVALIAGLGADLFFPGYKVFDGTTVFYGSLTAGLTLFNLTISFGGTTVLIGMSRVRQARERPADKGLLWRRMIIGPLCLVISLALCLGTTYMLSRRVVVEDEGIRYRYFIEAQEVRWKDIRSMNGNFVPGGRLGLKGRNRYAWVAFVTNDGETVRPGAASRDFQTTGRGWSKSGLFCAH